MNKKYLIILWVLVGLTTICIAEKINVAVYVELENDEIFKKCISLEESSSGYDAIKKAGSFGLKSFGFGHAICNIKGDGCSTNNCFCGGSDFWNFWVNGGLGSTGIDDYTVEQGDVLGFTWGGWGANPPADEGFESICIPEAGGRYEPRIIDTQIGNTLKTGAPVDIYVHRKGQMDYPEPMIKVDMVPIDETDKWRPKDRINRAQKILTAISDWAGKLSFTPSITGNYMLYVYKDGVEPINYSITVTDEIVTTTTTSTSTSTTMKIKWDGKPVRQPSWWLAGWYNY